MDDECVEELGRPISTFKVTELRDELTRRALAKSGNKKELIDRLRHAIQRQCIQTHQNTIEPQETAIADTNLETQVSLHESQSPSREEVKLETQNPVNELQEQTAEVINTKPEVSLDESQKQSVEEVTKNEEVSCHDSGETSSIEPQLESQESQESPELDVATETKPISKESKDLPTVEHESGIQDSPKETASAQVSSEPNLQELQDVSSERPHQDTQVSNQDLHNDSPPGESNTESQILSQASFSLKRGNPELRGSAQNKEKKRKWSNKKLESNLSGDSSHSTFMVGGISSQKLQELIEVKNIADKSTEDNNSVAAGTTQEPVDAPNENLEEGEINTSAESMNLDNNAKEKVSIEQDQNKDEDNQVERGLKESKDVSNSDINMDPTNILLVENLVRPFTIMQLKEVLTKHGPINEDKFWTDKVKSKCCVVFETVEVAQLTKESLQGQQWPSSNPKTLKISYIDEEALEKYQKSDLAKTPEVANSNSKSHEQISSSDQNANKSISNRLGDKLDRGQETSIGEAVKKRLGERVASDATVKSNRVGENSKPQELDDLFKKTKSIPHLFWLPLTESQADLKQKERSEREKRSQELAQKARRLSPPKRRTPPRNRSPRRRQPSSRHSITEKRRSRSTSRSRSPIERRSSVSRYRSPMSRRSPPPRHHSPIDRNPSPPLARRRSPNQSRRSPPPIHQRSSPGLVRRSPGLVRRSPGPMRRGGQMRRSPGPNRRSPGPTRRSPSHIRRSPAMIRRSPPPIRGSSPSDRSPPRKRSPRRRSPDRNPSPGRQMRYSEQHRRPQRLDRL